MYLLICTSFAYFSSFFSSVSLTVLPNISVLCFMLWNLVFTSKLFFFFFLFSESYHFMLQLLQQSSWYFLLTVQLFCSLLYFWYIYIRYYLRVVIATLKFLIHTEMYDFNFYLLHAIFSNEICFYIGDFGALLHIFLIFLCLDTVFSSFLLCMFKWVEFS